MPFIVFSYVCIQCTKKMQHIGYFTLLSKNFFFIGLILCVCVCVGGGGGGGGGGSSCQAK